ncbi:MAG: chromosome segregation protein SMC [Pseudomonadota bacterium]
MKFNKLRITGFKTFVEPTDFNIDAGLTGVVGPNGCGKSNLVEAMRWAMGESSYKAMRASGMEEVIFSGSNKRPARNWAEVRLFLDNSDRRAPAAFNAHEQLEVSRRIDRDKGSNYRVNGREARARDVQLLFADAASGARSPSMVRQGQIGEIISAKPVQRRALLEEAAGIAGLHQRRHEAELRLRAAEANIERLDDVIAELDKQLENLRKQARQARRFREVAAKLRAVEAGVFALKWAAANQAANDAASDLEEASKLLQIADETQLSAGTEQASIAARMPQAQKRAAEAGAALSRLIRAKDELLSEARRITDRVETAKAQLQVVEADLARDEEQRDNAAQERGSIEAELAASRSTLLELDNELAPLAAKLQASEGAFTEAAGRTNAARDELSRAEGENSAREAEIGRARSQHEKLSAELASAMNLLGELEQNAPGAEALTEARSVQSDAEKRRSRCRAALIETEQKLGALREAAASAEGPLREAERSHTTLQAEINALQKLIGHGSSKDVEGGVAVLEALNVEPGLEAALGAALGEALEASQDENGLHYWRDLGQLGAMSSLPAPAAPLSDFTSGYAPLSRILSHIGIVDESDGGRLQRELLPGQMLVSRAGAVWRWDGYTRRADAPSSAAVKLVERNRLEGLGSKLEGSAALLSGLQQAWQKCREELQQAEQRLVTLRHDDSAARDDFEKASSLLSALEREADRHSTRLDAARDEVARLSSAKAETEQALAKATTDPQVAGTMNALKVALEERLKEGAAARDALSVVQDQRRAIDQRLSEARVQRQAAERALEAWTRRAEEGEQRSAMLQSRKKEIETTIETLDGAPGELVEKQRALASQIAGAEEKRRQTADALAEIENALRLADQTARQKKDVYFEAREAHGRADERKTAAEERRAALQNAIFETIDAAPHELMTMAGFEPGKAPPPLENLESQLAQLKEARGRLGAVNLAAEQELEEVAERRDGLVMERDDVAEAITKLRSTISSINQEGRAKLLEAFDQVDTQFKSLFERLFGGGDAKLVLVDADDPLDAGLEIIAKPPGKRPQSITLLSGGEQALTALALIFAVFLSNPAPICVLDEVDAPLDDANVERFCSLLDDMIAQTETRFLVVTHNPITMSRMQRLYGVTMAERGVSQIVSVELEEAEAMVENESVA